jgi:SAM-dependent methyltransferase
MRESTRATVEHYVDQLDISGDVLEIGGYTMAKCAIGLFPEPRFRYRDMDIDVMDIPGTVIADITDCRAHVPDESVDLVLSCDVFEHIDRPWLAAAEIARILRPGGIAITRTVWAWRNHPCPIDFWRFSPECLEFIFEPLECLEKGYDLSERRADYPGFWTDGGDSVAVDAFGGFRENWAVYSVHRKGPGPSVPTFKASGHPAARSLRQDTQGTVTNPELLGLPKPPDPLAVANQLAQLDRSLDALDARLGSLGKRLSNIDQRLGQVNRGMAKLSRVSNANAPLPLRAYRGLRAYCLKIGGSR